MAELGQTKGLKIKHKLQATGILFLILMAIVIYFFLSSSTLIQKSSEQQNSLISLSENIQQTELAIKEYVTHRIPIDAVQKQFDQLAGQLKEKALADNLGKVRGRTENFRQLSAKNQGIEEQITKLTELSLTASNDVIKAISDRLIGEETRDAVSNMERAVLVGANMNTNANFRIRLLFDKLKADIGVKDELLKFLDTLVANVTKDIELLKGTDNEAAARQAKENNLLIKKLVEEFIANVNSLNAIEQEIATNLASIEKEADILVRQSSQDVFATIKSYFTTIIGVILIASVLGIMVNFFLAKGISGSLNQLIRRVKDLAEGEGDLTKRIMIKNQDETGELAQWINFFVEKLQKLLKEVSGNSDSLNNASSTLADIAEQMSDGARQASQKSNAVATAADEMSSTMNSVAAASEQASTNVAMVASASEEMAITVKEIAKSSEKARTITNDAVGKANGAASSINKLGEAADQISKVTEVITEISEQTNLLALNATIEAARAGEAGKGFAVVANEIKELAKQTAQATQEIKAKIEGIQNSSTQTIGEIKMISDVIKDVDTIVSAIAAAVEEQSATTQEIAGNVAQASQGINDVNEKVSLSSSVSVRIAQEVAEVNQAAGLLVNNSSQVTSNSTSLATLAATLQQTVRRFKL